MKKILGLTICLSVGIIGGNSLADTGALPCPPIVTPCAKTFGKMGGPVWVCCKDASGAACINYSKQKWMCLNAPGEPAAFGWELITTTDTLNKDCDPHTPGNCL